MRPSQFGVASQAAPHREPSRTWFGYVLCVGACALLFHFWQAYPVPTNVYLAGIAVIAVCLFPIARWYALGGESIPMFELICLAYLLQFGLPVFLNYNGVFIQTGVVYIPWDDTFQTLVLVATGVGVMTLAYYGVRFSRLAAAVPRLDLPLSPENRKRYIALGIVCGLAFAVLDLPASPFSAIFRVAANQINVAIVLLAYDVFGLRSDEPGRRLLLFGTVAVAAILGFAGGALEEALIPLVLITVVYWHVNRRFPKVPIVLALIAVLLVNGVKVQVRKEVEQAAVPSDRAGQAQLWLQQTGDEVRGLLSPDFVANSQSILQTSVVRIDFLHVFARVHSLTPTPIPYYGGLSYQYFLGGWIPRAVWPDKPDAIAAQQRLTVDYAFQLPTNVTLYSYGLGQITEAYANFGAIGVLIFMIIQGIFFAVIDASLNGPESDGGRAVYLSVTVILLNGIGASTAVIFGNMVQNLLSNAVIVRLFACGWRSGPGSRPAPAVTRPTAAVRAE